MQERKYNELEERASNVGMLDEIKNLEARTRIHQEIEKMRVEGSALALNDEEINMLYAFRRFRLRQKARVEHFSWRTERQDGIQIAKDTAEIAHPSEALLSSPIAWPLA